MNTKQITIDVELSRVIEANRLSFQETECQILLRLLDKQSETASIAESPNSPKKFKVISLNKPLAQTEFWLKSPLHKKDVDAKGKNSANGFTVMKGSKISKEITDGMPDYYAKLRNRLILEGVIDKNTRLFTRDYEFSKMSPASSVILGVSSNGKTAWTPANEVEFDF